MTSQLIQIPEEFKAIAAVLPISNHAPNNGMTVNGRELHAAAQVSTYYTTWVQRAIEKADLVDGVDYFSVESVKTQLTNLEVGSQTGGKATKDFYFTTTAAKEIVMMTKSKLGKVTRRFLIWTEESARQTNPNLPQQFAATQPASALGVIRSMVDVLDMHEVQIAETKAAVYLVKAETSDQFGEQTLTHPQQEQVLDAIDARLISLGINKSKKVFGHLPVRACVIAELKRAFFKNRRSEFTYKNLMQNQLATALTFIANWTPDAQLASALAPKIK